MMAWLSQVFTISWFNIKNLRQRLGSSLSTVIGVAGVVLVFIGVLSIAAGFQNTMGTTGTPENVLVMRAGSTDEMSSGLILDDTKVIAEGPGVAQGAAGPLASAELFVIVDVPKVGSDTPANVPLRGVSPAAFDVREVFEIVEGRNFEPGKSEIIVGQAASGQFEGLKIGDEKRWGESVWTVVGIFSTGGTVFESEIWCDAKVLQPAYRRGNSFQSVQVKLESASAFQAYKDALTTDPRVNVMVQLASDYYSGQSEGISNMISGMGILIGLLMGFGAVFGALNTMYSAVSARTKEIATLRALGFGTSPVILSVLIEGVLLAAIGGIAGALLAYGLFNGAQAATMNWQTFSQVAFSFRVTIPLMIGGLLYALVMGFVGGFFPAIRSARLPVATALREQ